MNDSSILDSRIFSTLILFALLAVVILLWLWLPEYMAKDISTLGEKGVFGDSYGSVNSLFTGLAFSGLIFTIFLQQREIKLQRNDYSRQIEEMQLSRSEVARQTDIQEKQAALSMANLKMKALEAKIEYIQMEGTQWNEGSRFTYVGPKLEEVHNEMTRIVDELENGGNA